MSAAPTGFRKLTKTEQAILDRLLETQFSGRDEIYEQLKDCLVRTIDEEGSLEFKVDRDVRAPVTRRVPVEARATDEDGVPVLILLHVLEGVISELEIVKMDGSPVRKVLQPSDLREVDWHLLPGDSGGRHKLEGRGS